jgi:hypothetical protein
VCVRQAEFTLPVSFISNSLKGSSCSASSASSTTASCAAFLCSFRWFSLQRRADRSCRHDCRTAKAEVIARDLAALRTKRAILDAEILQLEVHTGALFVVLKHWEWLTRADGVRVLLAMLQSRGQTRPAEARLSELNLGGSGGAEPSIDAAKQRRMTSQRA